MLERQLIPSIAKFFVENLTTLPFASGTVLDHAYISANQHATEALVEFGWAKDTSRGAVLLDEPDEPEILPRWDDICVTVIKLAGQSMTLEFHSSKAAASRIAPAFGLHGAEVDPAVYDILQSLGLVHNNQWTVQAETILWRCLPYESSVDFNHDPRFQAAVDHAVATMPADIEAEIKDLLADPSDVVKQHFLTWVFFEKWRLSDGWLVDETGGKALAIFHDDLAEAVSAEVARRLCT